MFSRYSKYALFCAAAVLALSVATVACLRPVPHLNIDKNLSARITDRSGMPLAITYQSAWNTDHVVPYYQIPAVLKTAVIAAEDRRFYSHTGVDWRARAAALYQNLSSRKSVRGASTITEQVVRLHHPRSRNLWSKWLEGFEARMLENVASKPEILEFYLNQVPYAANRRGVAQAARYYFNRDLNLLTEKEILALAVLPRAPSGFDLYKNPRGIDTRIAKLAKFLGLTTHFPSGFSLQNPKGLAEASHFAAYVRSNMQHHDHLRTTLDANMQAAVQDILDARMAALGSKKVFNGAVLVADHKTAEILAWVVAGAEMPETPFGRIDAVLTPRQPGSAMKPFLYAAALDRGWTAATVIDDAPLSEAIGTGLHRFKNYSNIFYGPVTLREALANSLNIPALKTLRHVGTQDYLTILRQLGFASLDRAADVYDEGLALGNGEVRLLDMVGAYAALARGGAWQPLRVSFEEDASAQPKKIFSAEASSIIGNILSDPWARRLEFGSGSVLSLPVQTAVKTGTSTDYRDAWALGYNDRFVVGVWMGNLDYTPTDGVTGASGPALVLRSVFNLLNKDRQTARLNVSSRLLRKTVCVPQPGEITCAPREELFIPGTENAPLHRVSAKNIFEVIKPTDGLRIAIDPRIPLERQKMEFLLKPDCADCVVEWRVNQALLPQTGTRSLWPLEKGQYRLTALVKRGSDTIFTSPEISYIVK
jgi:penicillin-binding protein 1C